MAWYSKVQYLDYVTYNQEEMAKERKSTIGDYVEEGFEIINQNGNKVLVGGGISHIGGFYMETIGDSDWIDIAGKKYICAQLTAYPAKDEDGMGYGLLAPYAHPSNDEAGFKAIQNKWVNNKYTYLLYTIESDGSFTRENTSKGYNMIDVQPQLNSVGGQLWFDVNGHESNRLNIDFTGITQRVLTPEDIGLQDEDFPEEQDMDAFVSIIGEKLPADSILIAHCTETDKLSKSFPFDSYGGLMAIKKKENGKESMAFQFYIEGGGIDSGLGGMAWQSRPKHTLPGDVWYMNAETDGTSWTTPGYRLITENVNQVKTKQLTDSETKVSFFFGIYDEFTVIMKNNYNSNLSEVAVSGYGQTAALSASTLVSNVSSAITAYREAQIHEHDISFSEYMSTNGKISTGKVFAVHCRKTGFYKNNFRAADVNRQSTRGITHDGTKEVKTGLKDPVEQ